MRGDWITVSTGRRYYWAGQPIARKWWTVDGDRYFFGDHGDALTGFSEVPRGNSGQGADYYLFDAEGALIVQPGLYQLSSDLSHGASGFSAGYIVCCDEKDVYKRQVCTMTTASPVGSTTVCWYGMRAWCRTETIIVTSSATVWSQVLKLM